MRSFPAFFLSLAILFTSVIASAVADEAASPGRGSTAKVPFIDGEWWTVAGQPDIGEFTTPNEEPVDFSVWQAGDGTWQLWSCIRRTTCGGKNRLFHGWESPDITKPDWKPMGIQMQADTKLGETEGGLQAPHVVKIGNTWQMLYGDWEHICLATSKDGKKFERYIPANGKTGLFTEGIGGNTRDACALLVGDKWYVYYTAFPNRQGVDYCRTSPDLKTYSESTAVAFGGRSGIGGGSAECPHVVEQDGIYYMFRTQHYPETNGGPRTCVYASTDPLNFGINQDRLYFVTEMPIAAPEIVTVNGQQYIAALLPSVKGIRIAKLGWKNRE
jgi:hypothetical protein